MMTKIKYYTMTEAFENYETAGGIFSNTISYPWSSTIANELINDMYFSEYGECLAGTYILHRLKDSETLDSQSRIKISSMIAYRFMTKWSKLWATMFFEYNPINNYDMIEEEQMSGSNENTIKNTAHSSSDTELSKTLNTKQTVSGSDSHTQNDTQTFNNTDTINLTNSVTSNNTITKDLTDTKTETIENTVEGTETNTKSIYGFNSQTAAPSEKIDATKNETGNTTTSGTVKYTGTESNNQTDNTTGETTTAHTGTIKNDSEYSGTNSNTTDNTGTITDTDINNSEFTENNTSSGSNSSNRKLTRSGNIGITTSQQMIQSERDLWLWDFFKVVFTDVNKMFTLPIF